MFATHVPILGWVYCALLLLPTGPDRAAMRRGLSASTRAARNPGTALLDCRTCCVTKHKHQLPANAHVRCLGLVSVARSNFCRVCPCGDEHCACTRQRCRRTSPGRRCSLVDQTQRPPQGWSIFDQPISIAHTCRRAEENTAPWRCTSVLLHDDAWTLSLAQRLSDVNFAAPGGVAA